MISLWFFRLGHHISSVRFFFFITYKTGLVKNPLIAFYSISDKASSSATIITLGWSLKTEPGTCGVIGPFTTAFNAAALSFPLTTSRISFCAKDSSNTHCVSLFWDIICACEETFVGFDRALGQVNNMNILWEGITWLVETDMSITSQS